METQLKRAHLGFCPASQSAGIRPALANSVHEAQVGDRRSEVDINRSGAQFPLRSAKSIHLPAEVGMRFELIPAEGSGPGILRQIDDANEGMAGLNGVHPRLPGPPKPRHQINSECGPLHRRHRPRPPPAPIR